MTVERNDTEPTVEFGDLPSDRRGGGGTEWSVITEKLRANPGQWAKIATKGKPNTAASVARNIRLGVLAAWRGAEYEAVSRGCDVWVRFVGESL